MKPVLALLLLLGAAYPIEKRLRADTPPGTSSPVR